MTESSTTFGFNEITDLSKDLLKQGVSVKLRAGGFSMFPALRRKDILQVRPVPPTDIQPGDIIVFFRVNRFIAHRVHDMSVRDASDFECRTIGDSSLLQDERVHADNYLGKVTAFERRGQVRSLTSGFNARYGRFVVKSFPFCNALAGVLLKLNLFARRIVRLMLRLAGRR